MKNPPASKAGEHYYLFADQLFTSIYKGSLLAENEFIILLIRLVCLRLGVKIRWSDTDFRGYLSEDCPAFIFRNCF